MKEIFIFFVIVFVLALTAVRYRKQIAGMIGVAKMLNEMKNSVVTERPVRREEAASVALVNCAKCGVWVPQDKSVKRRDGTSHCLNCS